MRLPVEVPVGITLVCNGSFIFFIKLVAQMVTVSLVPSRLV